MKLEGGFIKNLGRYIRKAALGPVKKKINKRKNKATNMFNRLKKRTPFFKPVMTDIVAIKVITIIITIWVKIPELIPVKKFNPDAICLAPKPNEVAKPKRVATTAIISIITP